MSRGRLRAHHDVRAGWVVLGRIRPPRRAKVVLSDLPDVPVVLPDAQGRRDCRGEIALR